MTLTTLGAASVCQRCAESGPTCCEPEPGLPLAALTPGDVARIAAATGLPPTAFTESRQVDATERAFLQKDDRLLARLVQDGNLVSLAKRGRACVFHEAGRGCSLAYEVRPLLCRRFPIVRQGRFLNVRPGGRCLAVEEARDMSQLLQSLGLSEAELERLEQKVRADTQS
jgi:Fe-S-cluster containining protein